MNSIYIFFAIALYILTYLFYISVSHGLGHKAEHLQLRRFIPCVIIAVLPAALTGLPLTNGLFLVPFLVGLAWIITYPLLYSLTYKKISSDFGFHLDMAFGLYIIGYCTALKLLIIYSDTIPNFLLIVVSALEVILLLIPLLELNYYYLYHNCINENGMILILETDRLEAKEYFVSLPKALLTAFIIFVLLIFVWLAKADVKLFSLTLQFSTPTIIILGIISIFLTVYLWKPKKNLFKRTGIIELYLNVKDYFATYALYKKNQAERLKDLQVTPTQPSFAKPSTIIMVIGESASRNYMSAFVDMPENSTPWLKAQKASPNFLLFPGAYACAGSTVPALERALTEFNQYDGNEFYTACSVVDIARAAGYKPYWFSNQGYLGDVDTPVTLVAKTCDKAAWTGENLNKLFFDSTLLDYFTEVDPTENNFIVFHLKGSHFNYINRYPQDRAHFSKPHKYDLVPNYLDSLAYTDYILEQIHTYAKEHFNLQAMLYFSDHGEIPTSRRNPDSKDFPNLRIPMFTYFSDEYKKLFPDTFETLKAHQNRYFTNDLIYELVCGIFHIKSNHYKEENGFASPQFKFTTEMLKTYSGMRYIKDDILSQTPR